MGDQEIKECLALMEPNVGTPPNSCAVSVFYKPIIVPGLIYRTIITGGFLQLMMTNDQYAGVRFNNLIKYYEDQRKEAIEYLRKEASKVASKRLVVPQDEFLRWMKDGCIDFDTYVVLRNCVLKKSYRKRMALRKELEEAKKMLAPVGIAAAQLIGKVDTQEFSSPSPEATGSPAARPVVFSLNEAEIVVKCNPEEPAPLPPFRQALCGMMFGLLAAKAFCSFLLRVVPPKLGSPIT